MKKLETGLLEDTNAAIGKAIKEVIEDATNRLNCDTKDLAMRMDSHGGLLVTTKKELKRMQNGR